MMKNWKMYFGRKIREGQSRKKCRVNVVWMLAAVEIAFLLYSFMVLGRGFLFFQFAVILLPVSLLVGLTVKHMKADYILAVLGFTLLNIGFMVQMVSQSGASRLMTSNIKKTLFVFITAFIFGVLFLKFSYLLSYDKMVFALIAVQGILELVLLVKGSVTGDMNDQGAKLSLRIGFVEVLPLEVVKVIYLFVLVLLLCKDECRDKKILGLPREVMALLYSAFTFGSICFFGELGSILVLFLTGGIIMTIYCHNRRFLRRLYLCTSLLGALAVAVCMKFHTQISLLDKVYKRFQYVVSPERDASGLGMQGLRMREGLAVGGAFGAETQRYLIYIPQETDDMIFAKIVQCCGAVMGFLVILMTMMLIRQGLIISQKAKDTYYSGLAMGMTVMIAIETVIHVGYNVGIMPITGISYYLVSSGFTSVTVAVLMITVLLMISTNTQERSAFDEREFDKKTESLFRRVRRA